MAKYKHYVTQAQLFAHDDGFACAKGKRFAAKVFGSENKKIPVTKANFDKLGKYSGWLANLFLSLPEEDKAFEIVYARKEGDEPSDWYRGYVIPTIKARDERYRNEVWKLISEKLGINDKGEAV